MRHEAPSRWPDMARWMWLLRASGSGLVLADVSLGRPSPGFSGDHLVVLVGSALAALAWLGQMPAARVDERLGLAVLVAGMVGGCLATLASPNSAALTFAAVIGLLAGSSLSLVQGVGVAVTGLATLVAGSFAAGPRFSLLGSSLAVVGGLLAGLWRRQFILRAEQAELVAVETKRAEAEHVRAQVLDERARIAREIHDVLAHTLGGLVIQLDAADALLSDGGDAERGRRLVVGARRLAVEGLEETRQAITALRTDPVALPELLAALATGDDQSQGQVSHQLSGSPRQLGPDAGLAVYRTAQEALANARKHAPGAPVAMMLSFEDREAVLRVTNHQPPEPCGTHELASTGGGHGLNGLRERAELLGGTLDAGPSQGGWTVELRVPG